MSSNRTIAKNTLFLYSRMFITMGISLYTSRLILQTLGVEDFGVYNLVGGVVVLFSFLNNAMSAATQRYLNIKIASKIKEEIRRVFSMSLNVHLLISILVLLLSETVGLWFLNHKLNIPPDRLYAANMVYQFSVFTTVVEILKVPYNAIVIANEKMLFFAITSVIETILRMVAVISLSWFLLSDKLILYGILILILNLCSSLAFIIFCKTQFKEEVSYIFRKDKALFVSLLSFSGWSLLGQVSVLTASQGVSMILNIFIGVVINAAMGIAGQISGAVYSFISNAQLAFNPQIVQSYADNNPERHIQLVLQASRFSFFLFTVLCIPFLIGTNYIIEIWLGPGFPEYSIQFTKIILLTSVISSLAGPLWMSAYAVGDIRNYQFCVSIINLMTLPTAYILLMKGFSPSMVLIAKLIIDAGLMVFRVYYFKKTLLVAKSVIWSYLRSFIPILLLLFIGAGFLFDKDISSFVEWTMYSLFAEAVVLSSIWYWGIKKSEYNAITGFFRDKIKRLT